MDAETYGIETLADGKVQTAGTVLRDAISEAEDFADLRGGPSRLFLALADRFEPFLSVLPRAYFEARDRVRPGLPSSARGRVDAP